MKPGELRTTCRWLPSSSAVTRRPSSTNAIRLPSADHAGCSPLPEVVRRMLPWPFGSIVQISVVLGETPVSVRVTAILPLPPGKAAQAGGDMSANEVTAAHRTTPHLPIQHPMLAAPGIDG